jgi:hypothetical protein
VQNIYTKEELGRELRQSEIITDLTQYVYDPVAGGAVTVVQPYVVVLTQDCDLLQDYERRQSGESGTLNGILFYEAQPTPDARLGMPRGGDIWKRVYNNKDERYHYLEKVPANCDCLGQGLPDLVIDFKRCFTLDIPEIYRQLSAGERARRRTRLETPYREHLQARVAFYLQRVGIPRPHEYVAPQPTPALPKPG